MLLLFSVFLVSYLTISSKCLSNSFKEFSVFRLVSHKGAGQKMEQGIGYPALISLGSSGTHWA